MGPPSMSCGARLNIIYPWKGRGGVPRHNVRGPPAQLARAAQEGSARQREGGWEKTRQSLRVGARKVRGSELDKIAKQFATEVSTVIPHLSPTRVLIRRNLALLQRADESVCALGAMNEPGNLMSAFYLGPSAPLVGKRPKTPDDGTQNHQISGQSGTVSEHDNMGAERILAAHWGQRVGILPGRGLGPGGHPPPPSGGSGELLCNRSRRGAGELGRYPRSAFQSPRHLSSGRDASWRKGASPPMLIDRTVQTGAAWSRGCGWQP
eukprot:1196194-Prorocentrum_minimum.AAC.11